MAAAVDPYFCPDRICFNVGRELYVYPYRYVFVISINDFEGKMLKFLEAYEMQLILANQLINVYTKEHFQRRMTSMLKLALLNRAGNRL
jgi:hypothetical protein